MAEFRNGLFHYTGSGLSNVWLKNGYEIKETPYGEGVAVHDVDGLHRAIGHFLVHHKDHLSGEEVRFLRKEMDLPQNQLAALLKVSLDTLRGWENNRTPITGSADELLRAYYAEAMSEDPATRIRERLKHIAELNREIHAETLEFEETESGWEPTIAA